MASDREQLWRRRVDEQRTSGMTIRAYCQAHSLREPSFYFWRRTFAERDRAVDVRSAEPTFVAVETLPPLSPAAVEVHLPNGTRVSVTPGCEATLLAMVLAALAERPC